MVRGRRTRRAAASTTTTTITTTTTTTQVVGPAPGSLSPNHHYNNNHNSHSPLAQENNGVKVVSKNGLVLVDDFCCASPKRKEYKIDEVLFKNNNNNHTGVQSGGYTLGNGTTTTTTTMGEQQQQQQQPLVKSPSKTRMVLRGTQNSSAAANTTNGGPVTNGRLCPVAGNEITRFLLSQSKSKSRKARKKSPNFELVNDDTCDSFTHATSLQEQQQQLVNGVVKMEADEITEEGQQVVMTTEQEDVHPFQMFGRLPIGNGMAAEENIFLQEPVLKLTVDEAACVLVQLKQEQCEATEQARKEAAAVAVALINQDSNSGDSGVVIDKLQEAAAAAAVSAQNVTPKPLLNVNRPRVPTTPHRILCPSSPQPVNATGRQVKEEDDDNEQENGEATLMTEEEEENAQTTKRKLILPTKDEEEGEDETTTPSAANTHNGVGLKEEEQEATEEKKVQPEVMKAPKTNGVVGRGAQQQSTMEDFFKVRRSVRKTKKEVEREEQLAIEKAILSECDIGLAVKMFENKGRGIVATRPFCRGEFVVEYVGEFISIAEANRREKLYAQDQNTGCYMYYFRHKNKQYCIDATRETGKLGRLVNHSRNGNLMTRTVEVKGKPHLVLIAKEDIEEGRELNYDYGDRSKESLLHHPWLAY